MPLTRITVLISGNGTNLQAIIDAINEGKIQQAQIVQVISNRLNAYGRRRAIDAGIPTAYHNLKTFGEQHPDLGEKTLRESYDKALADLVLTDQPNLIVCAGFMHILSPAFLDPLAKSGVPVLNLHPALPNCFPGIDAIGRAYQAFKDGSITKTGVMVHYVIAEIDAVSNLLAGWFLYVLISIDSKGEPLVIKELDIDSGEELAQLEERIHHLEWQAIIEGVQLAIQNFQNAR
ncbi:MAG: hypothetical protein LQ343_007553 [Gyalolechia ehrenbergii]|nr:MAG: hypothetical protein LQ343_007553 [Gyalolechia ehrenbergii]